MSSSRLKANVLSFCCHSQVYDNVVRRKCVLYYDYPETFSVVCVVPAELPQVKLGLLLLVDFELDPGYFIDLSFSSFFVSFSLLFEPGWFNTHFITRPDLSAVPNKDSILDTLRLSVKYGRVSLQSDFILKRVKLNFFLASLRRRLPVSGSTLMTPAFSKKSINSCLVISLGNPWT